MERYDGRELSRGFIAVLAAIFITGVFILSGFVGCTTVGQFKAPEQSACDKIAYYDQYVEAAQRALFVLQFAPGLANYLGAAAASLVLVDCALDDAKAVCDLAAHGSPEQTKAALDAVWRAVTNFNTAYGQAKAAVRGAQ